MSRVLRLGFGLVLLLGLVLLAVVVPRYLSSTPPPAGPVTAAPGVPVDPDALPVLFVGNSFTFVNDLPGTFAALARSRGEKVRVEMAAPGGFTFAQHAGDPSTLAKIRAAPWAFVVLQEQSQRPSFEDEQVTEKVLPNARRLDSFIHAANPKAHTVFYETWGRRDGDSSNCSELPAICTYQGMQERIDATYERMARDNGALLAPVGRAWAKVRAAHPEVNLYGGDGIHPSPQGTYLAGCVLYATIYREPATGLSRLSLAAEEAALLQEAADAAMRERP